jgi:hypothetical protein
MKVIVWKEGRTGEYRRIHEVMFRTSSDGSTGSLHLYQSRDLRSVHESELIIAISKDSAFAILEE